MITKKIIRRDTSASDKKTVFAKHFTVTRDGTKESTEGFKYKYTWQGTAGSSEPTFLGGSDSSADSDPYNLTNYRILERNTSYSANASDTIVKREKYIYKTGSTVSGQLKFKLTHYKLNNSGWSKSQPSGFSSAVEKSMIETFENPYGSFVKKVTQEDISLSACSTDIDNSNYGDSASQIVS